MVGYTASMLREAAELRAAAERRPRPRRSEPGWPASVHDGVLQVLALVQRRGLEAGGDLAELGRLAGEQEAALRALVQGDARERTGQLARRPRHRRWRRCDTGRGDRVRPGVPVELPGRRRSRSSTAVVRACLDNVARHVGEGAPAWVLVEDLGDRVVVSVRDEGPGIPDGRLEEAAGDGRLGVTRVDPGPDARPGRQRAELITGPGQGTEWELTVPRIST